MKSYPLRKILLISFSFFLFFSCQEGSIVMDFNGGDEKPEILYTSRKFVSKGWGVAVSLNIMDAEGVNHREIISVSDGAVKDADFSGDGAKIVFVMHSDALGNSENLYTIDYDGTNLAQLTLPDSTLTYFVPQLHPTGASVIYQARVNDQEFQIRSIDITSKQQTVLVPQTDDMLRPVLSRDGAYLFYNNIDGNVHRISLNGNVDEQLTFFEYTSQIQLSGDGRTVYFVSKTGSMLFDLFSMTLEGDSIQRVTNRNDLSCAYFRISPDKSKIINLTSSPSGHAFDIMNRDGSDRKIVQINKPCGDTFEFFPDGQQVVFEVWGDFDHNGDVHIYKIGASGSGMKILSLDKYHDNQFCCFRPVW